jgi:DNA end-binding protein Ku
MQRSLWHGAISFGLIYVPVELYAAAKDGALDLHMLDSRDFAPVGYQRVNKSNGKTVDWQHIVKGYEYKKGQYVALSDADFKHANAKATETIQIDTFTDAADIPPMYFETPYYLAPTKGGQKVYALLREALRATRKVAVATFVMRGRQHLCVIASMNDTLMLLTLRFASEVLPPAALAAVSGKTGGRAGGGRAGALSSAELTMAKHLVEQMSGPWNPAAFKDTYRADLMRTIQEKIRNKQTHVLSTDSEQPSERPKAQVIDLMEALKKSLKNRGMDKSSAAAARKPAKVRRRA